MIKFCCATALHKELRRQGSLTDGTTVAESKINEIEFLWELLGSPNQTHILGSSAIAGTEQAA